MNIVWARGSLLTVTLILATAWAVETAKESPQAPPANQPTSEPAKAPPDGPAEPMTLEGVHNVFHMGRKIISGSCPEGEAGYRALAQQGVRTIISVDGARPDLQWAQKYKMRYVHIPVAYGGITRTQSLAIARAVRDLEGPVFIHCHHGQHRGPTAAVIAAMVNEGWTTDQAQAAMKQAGTSLHYTGLWAAARDFKKPSKEELDKADKSFPAAAAVPALAAAMSNIDVRWEHMGDVRKADWKTPPDHPDIDPPHEALLLSEDFRELLRTTEVQKKSVEFRRFMSDAESATSRLEQALREKDNEKAEGAFNSVGQTCKSCHAVYRDVLPDNETR